jgi:dynein heavy chain 1
LRPTAIQGQPAGSGGEAGDVIETDDLSAVREVKLAYENVKVVDCLDLTPEGNAAWEAALKR